MKALQIIATLCIAQSFSLYSSENEEYIGLQHYYPRYHESYSTEDSAMCGSPIYSYCTSNKKNAHHCDILNAFLLLNRFPHESVEEQIKFYTKSLEDTTSELNSTNDIFRKKDLHWRKSRLQRIIPQIQRARLSGNLQDAAIQEQVDTALRNTLSVPNTCHNGCNNSDYHEEFTALRKAVRYANQFGNNDL
jgi:hypothetical protein